MNHDKIEELIAACLMQCKLMSIASVHNSAPWVATVWFASGAEFRLYFLSNPATQHSQDIEENHDVAAAVYSSDFNWGDALRGLQIQGTARILRPEESEEAFDLYLEKFPQAIARLTSRAILYSADFKSRFYIVEPQVMKYFDETAFGRGGQIKLHLENGMWTVIQ